MIDAVWVRGAADGIANNLGGIIHDGKDVSCELRKAADEIERLRLALREIVRMAGKGGEAPMTAERWLDRIDETAIAALSPKEAE